MAVAECKTVCGWSRPSPKTARSRRFAPHGGSEEREGGRSRRTDGRRDGRTKGHPHEKEGSNGQMKEREGQRELGCAQKPQSTAGLSCFNSCCDVSRIHHPCSICAVQGCSGKLDEYRVNKRMVYVSLTETLTELTRKAVSSHKNFL